MLRNSLGRYRCKRLPNPLAVRLPPPIQVLYELPGFGGHIRVVGNGGRGIGELRADFPITEVQA